MNKKLILALLFLSLSIQTGKFVAAKDRRAGPSTTRAQHQIGDQKRRDTKEPRRTLERSRATNVNCGAGFRSSPFDPPTCNDTTFVTDDAFFLDTGCSFRSEGPLVFSIDVTRVVGDVQKLLAAGMISEVALLQMPAFDVDFFGAPGVNPERDRVIFNGHVVPGEFLHGDNQIWELNQFRIPIDWINFPQDQGPGSSVTPAENVIEIDIDTANLDEIWCTSIDWAALSFEVARPVVFVHGICSNGGAWDKLEFSWVQELRSQGLPNSNRLNMGDLDSIENNAAKITTEIDDARRRWGVEKVKLICHSKGGIDARQFVETNNGVEELIQLGTPNEGSPLANLGVSWRVLGAGASVQSRIVGAILGCNLEGSGGSQLTEPFMKLYNSVHGHNPMVSYTAIAGRYDPDCPLLSPLCRPIEQVLLSLTGPGDTIVPVSSVHSLSYTQNLTFDSSGENKEATHTSLNGSRAVFNLVANQAQEIGAPNVAGSTAPPPVHTASSVKVILQGEKQTTSIQIDQSTTASFTLFFPSGNLDLALISPSGQRFDPTTIIGNPNVSREEREILGGLVEVYSFAEPELGTWTAEVTAPSVTEPSGSVTYAVTAWLAASSMSLSFTGELENPSVHVGDKLRLLGTLKNGNTPITGARVSAIVGLPDSTVQTVVLRDDGLSGDVVPNDGVYTAEFAVTSQSGTYRVLFVANGDVAASGLAFSREEFGLATVSKSTSSFVGSFRGFGVDTDGNGLFNSLQIDADVNVTSAGPYRVFAVVKDSSDNEHEASATATLGVGINSVSLTFDGQPFFHNRVDGPYTLSNIRLAEESGNDILPVDRRVNAFQTAAFSFNEFEHPPLTLTGGGSAVGVDTNGNGLFDLLQTNIEVRIDVEGFYEWSARLTDVNGTELGFTTNSRFLNAGINNLDLIYGGNPIGSNGLNGPYFVRGLLLFGSGGSLVSSNAFATPSFLASQFEGFGPQPSISTTNPASVVAGSSGFTMTVSGANFKQGSTVQWNGSSRPTTFLSSMQLTAVISTADVSRSGTANIAVFNPPPGGGLSNLATFSIVNVAPTIGTVTPLNTTKNVPVSFTVSAAGNNPGEILTFSVGTPPTKGTLSGFQSVAGGGPASTGGLTLTYVPIAGVIGNDSFTITVSDGSANATSAPVSVAISNQAPVASAGPAISIDEVSSVILTGATASDPDAGDSLTISWTITGGSANGTLAGANTLTPTYTAPDLTSEAVRTVTAVLTVADGSGATATSNKTITVNRTLSVTGVTFKRGTLSIAGTGFVAGAIVKVDGVVVSASVNVAGTTSITVAGSRKQLGIKPKGSTHSFQVVQGANNSNVFSASP